MNRPRFQLLLALLLAASAPALRAFDFIDEMPAWPDGTVTLELQLGNATTYSDGTTPNGTAIEALQSWNPSMARVQLAYVNNSTATKSRTNGRNNVFFDSTVYGSDFGDGILAVAVSRWSGGRPTESDVVVNSVRTWDSYRGYLRLAYDLRRVLIHEFGHALGLDHPDEAGQWVDAIMNSHISDTDTVTQDDMDGVSTRYGRGPGNPGTPLNFTSHPFGGNYVEGRDLTLSGQAQSSLPILYQWYKDDQPLAGATEAVLRLNPLRTSHAGNYHLRASDDNGSIDSNKATLAVTPAQIPTFTSHPSSVTRQVGAMLNLNALATSNASINYQWTRDDADVAGATGSTLWIDQASMADAGVYRLVASTVSGSAKSNPATVTIIALQPPVIDVHPRSDTVIVGHGFALTAVAGGFGTIRRQWMRDDVPIPHATDAALYITNATGSDSGAYRMAATNEAGTTLSNPAQVTVVPVPLHRAIVLKNVELSVGSSLYINPDSPDSANTRFQWYHNGEPIFGATNSIYSHGAVDHDDAGEYFVVATNSAGSITSTTAAVTIVSDGAPPPEGWRQALNVDEITYFMFENPARLERFDLAREQWLSPLALSGTPTAMAVAGSNTAVIAFQRTLARIDLTTGQEAPLVTIDSEPYELGVHNGRLYIVAAPAPVSPGQRRLGSIDLAAPTSPLWSGATQHIGSGLSIDHSRAKAFTSATTAFPPDVTSAVLKSDGTIGIVATSLLHVHRTVGSKTWVNLAETLVVDSSGTLYRTEDLGFAGDLGVSFDHILFPNDGSALVLRGRTVSAYNQNLVESGSLQLSREARHLALLDTTLFAFAQPTAGSTIPWEKRGLDEFVPPPVLPEAAPGDAAFPVDDAYLDRDGILLLYSRLHGNVFRWSTHSQCYLDPIPLVGRPNAIAYSPVEHQLQLGYADNAVRVIDLAVSTTERVLIAAPSAIGSLLSCDDFLVVHTTWPRITLGTYDAHGARLATYESPGSVEAWSWEPTRSRLFELSGAQLRCLSMNASGQFAPSQASEVYFDYSSRPLRLSPEGTVAVTGTGQIFDADTLARLGQLPHALTDAAWLGPCLYTMHETLAGTEIKRWNGADYELDANCTLGGRSVRLFGLGTDRLVAVTQKGRQPLFTLLDADLNVRNHFEDAPDLSQVRLANLSTRARVGTGDNIMIAGFVVNGTERKRILVRAAGPTLKPMGVSGELLDPVLRVVTPTGLQIVGNDDWYSNDGDTLKQLFLDVGAFPMPEDSRDAALVVELAPGHYTAQVSGKDGTEGVALVETYDLDGGPSVRRLINISTRAVVGIGDEVMIPGLVIDGTAPKRVLIRAVGPGLSIFNLPGLLADPQFRVVDKDGAIVVANDNWGSDNTEVTLASSSAAGAFELASGSRDAALVTTLPPGSYTVVVSGVNDTTGLALVEIYEVP